MTVAEKLRRLLKTHSKKAVAKAAGISPNTLFSVLSGRACISLQTAASLAAVLGVRLGWLVDDSQSWAEIVRVPPIEKVQSVKAVSIDTAA